MLIDIKDKGNTEAATEGVLCRKVFLEISQNSQENTCTIASFLITLIKKLYLKRDSGADVFKWILRNF